VLLGAVTALIVARPLVAGEDPGRLNSPESMSGVVLNLLWMITAILGAIWFARSPRAISNRFAVPAGLAAIAAAVGLSAALAHCYHHPAWLNFWEWATLPVIFLLTRELGSDADPADDSAGGLLSALLASAISLAAFGIYQSAAHAAGLSDPEAIIETNPMPAPDADYLGLPASPAVHGIARGTFAGPQALIAVLLLAIPAVIVFGRRDRSWRSFAGLALAALMAVALALGLRDFQRQGGLEHLSSAWATGAKMLRQHPALGVGPGNFGRHSPQVQPTNLSNILNDPSNAYLELAATGGLLALMALGATAALTMFQIGRRQEMPSSAESTPPEPTPRWEFYLGGVFGLLLGLFLRLVDLPASDSPQSIVGIGAASVGRALVWFLAFALFEAVDWRSAARRRALLAGLMAVLLFGLVSGSVLLPAVSQWFWASAGIALSGAAAVSAETPRRLARWIAVPVFSVMAVTFFALVCSPVVDSALAMAEARRQARQYPRFLEEAQKATSGYDKRRRAKDAVGHIDKKIHKALIAAAAADPYDITPELESAEWFYELWKMAPNVNQELGIHHARRAAALDPAGTKPLIRELQLRLLFAGLDTRHFRPEDRADQKLIEHVAKLRADNFREARRLIDEIAERDPALEARVRFRLAQALINVNEPEPYRQGLAEAEQVLKLDESSPGPRWKLPREQRRQVRRWLKLFNDDEIVWPIVWPTVDTPVCMPVGLPSALLKK
jgi:hypothetical protein